MWSKFRLVLNNSVGLEPSHSAPNADGYFCTLEPPPLNGSGERGRGGNTGGKWKHQMHQNPAHCHYHANLRQPVSKLLLRWRFRKILDSAGFSISSAVSASLGAETAIGTPRGAPPPGGSSPLLIKNIIILTTALGFRRGGSFIMFIDLQ